MPYSLKLDWTHERAAAVVAVLERADLGELASENDLNWLASAGVAGDEMTLELDWNATEINCVRAVLGGELVSLERAMGGSAGKRALLAADQAEIWAARHDIEAYLVGSESLSDVSRAALAERPL